MDIHVRRIPKQPVFPQEAANPDYLSVSLGVDGNTNPLFIDIPTMPHVLIAGTTGSGKSTLVRSIVKQLIPLNCQLALIDPKEVEFQEFRHLPNLYGPVANGRFDSMGLLRGVLREMDRRFSLLAENEVRHIDDLPAEFKNKVKPIVVVVDELADLVMLDNGGLEAVLVRLSQKARAAGIYLILATQRPTVGVVNGLMKANIPARVALRVSSALESRVILDKPGAEKLGPRQMLVALPGREELITVTAYESKDV